MWKLLIILVLVINSSCASKSSEMKKVSQEKTEKTVKETKKLDKKKLAKEAGYMIGWDIVLAGVCKAGLHFSVGVCLAADVLGDAVIIGYHNFDFKKKNRNVEPKTQEASASNTAELQEKSSFHPVEFALGVGLMTVVLVLFP